MTGIKIYSNQIDRKKSRGSNTYSDKIVFKIRAIKRDTEGYIIILKGRIHQENTDIINTNASNIGASKYIYGKSWRTSRKILRAIQI